MTTPHDYEVRQACESERTAAALPGARLLVIAALVFTPLFAFFDGVVAPPELPLLRVWRLAMLTVSLFALLALYTEVGRRCALACGIVAVLSCGLNIEFLAPDGTVATHYYAAVIVALLGGWLALPWRPMQAAGVGGALVAAYAGGTLLLIGTRDAPQLLGHVVLMAGATGLVAAAAALREQERWRACSRRVGVETHARRQEAIASIGQLGFRTHDPRVLLERAVVWIGEALGTSQCAVWEAQADGKMLLLAAGVGWKDASIGRATLDARGRSHPAAVLRAGEPIVVEDFRSEKRMEKVGVFKDHAVTSGIGAVLRVRQQAYGVLTVYGATPREFTREDVEFLRSCARLLGSAMGEYRDEEASKSDAKASGALARAGRELLASLDPAVLEARLCQLTQEIVGCDQSSTWFVRWDREVIEAAAAYGIAEEAWATASRTPITLEALGSLLGRLSREEVVRVEAAEADGPLGGVLGTLGAASAMLILLRRDGEPVGLQMLGMTSDRAFSRHDERVAQGIAQLAGMALTNARVVQQLSAGGTTESSPEPTPVAIRVEPAPSRGFADAVAPEPSAANGSANGHPAPVTVRMTAPPRRTAARRAPAGDESDRSAPPRNSGDQHPMVAPPRGTTDQHLAATRANTSHVQAVAASAGAPARKRLLFADDLGMARLLFRKFIEREMPEIEVFEAFDGGQALAMVEAHRPDLVILDLQMPVVDGYEAARRVRALDGTADLPIIATSITAGVRVESAALSAGFTEFVPKPVSDYGPLKARIQHWLGYGRPSMSLRPSPPMGRSAAAPPL